MKYGNVFTQIMMFLLLKVDDLRVREQDREEKGITNSEPLSTKEPLFINFCTILIKNSQNLT